MRSATVLLVCAALVAGCGSSSVADTGAAHSGPRLTETACLKRAGARFASRPSDIAFFLLDRARGKAQKPGGAFLHHQRVVLEHWQSVPSTGAAGSRWELWSAQPLKAGRPLAPDRLVALGGADRYVAYIIRPRPRQVRAVDKCLNAVAGDRG